MNCQAATVNIVYTHAKLLFVEFQSPNESIQNV